MEMLFQSDPFNPQVFPFRPSQKNCLDQVKERMKEHGATSNRESLISELCLDEIKIGNMTDQCKSQIERCKSLIHLSLASCSFKQLQNMPFNRKYQQEEKNTSSTITLKYLNLQNNQLSDTTIEELQDQYEQLQGLDLSGNHITSIETLVSLIQSLKLKEINIFDNPVMLKENILGILFENCKSLKCINHQDDIGKEVINENEDNEEENSDSSSSSNRQDHSNRDSQSQQSNQKKQQNNLSFSSEQKHYSPKRKNPFQLIVEKASLNEQKTEKKVKID